MKKALLLVLVLGLLLAAVPAFGQQVELRITWYDDGNEGQVLRDLLDRFEAENPDIKVIVDTVPYSSGILEILPVQLEANQGPDMARVTQLGMNAPHYLDLRPYLSDPAYWEENFEQPLKWLRMEGDTEGIYGFPTQLTITGPFINRTLFEQAGVPVPSDTSDSVTWEEWAEAVNVVAEALDVPFPMAMDRSGHRWAGPSVSMGATWFNEEGVPDIVDDAGFRAMAEMFVDWHADGTMPLEIWAANAGAYAGANDQFKNAQLVFYMSGSWQVGQFTAQIGDAFDWEAVPNPCGPAACTGMPGGAALVAINDTQHPAEVARVMEYLASEDVLREFSARTLFIPGHKGLAETGIDFDTDLDLANEALGVFVAQVSKLEPLAYDLQAYTFNTLMFNSVRERLTQVIVGELTMDEAITRIQQDIDDGLAEAAS